MKFGERCTGCGECCLAIPCGLAFALFDQPEDSTFACPALEKAGDQYRCGLVLHPQQYIDLGEKAQWRDDWFGALIGLMLGIGVGCDSGPAAQKMRR